MNIFEENIRRVFLPKDDSKFRLFIHMFLSYSAFVMVLLTYIVVIK
jgi:hypothetical protein